MVRLEAGHPRGKMLRDGARLANVVRLPFREARSNEREAGLGLPFGVDGRKRVHDLGSQRARGLLEPMKPVSGIHADAR